MVNCNDCKHLVSSIHGQLEDRYIKHNCKKHNIELKTTSKIFKDRIIPCVKCNGKDFDLKEGVILGEL